MRILIAHNFYQQPGGEDVVFSSEADLLESRGHEVVRYTIHNDSIVGMGRFALLKAMMWNRRTFLEVRDLVSRRGIQIAHFHNTFPLISPSAFSAARQGGAAVVQTLHNYRLSCLNACFFRDGKPCERCLGKRVPWPGVAHKCYRESRIASATIATMLAAHRGAGLARRNVDLSIAPSEWARRKLVEAGAAADRLLVKPNFVHPDPGPGAGDGGYAVFVGRLSPEKGVDLLLRAWSLLPEPLELKIVGSGPMASLTEKVGDPRVQWLGRRTMAEVYDLVGAARMLIFPSPCYETFGRTVAEAFAKGTPVVVSDTGAAASMVDAPHNGRRFRAGDAADLARQVATLAAGSDGIASMRRAARDAFEKHYNAESNYLQLMAAYERAWIQRFGGTAVGLHHDELGRWAPDGSAGCRAAGAVQAPGDVLRSPIQ